MNLIIKTAAASVIVMGGGYIGYIAASYYKIRLNQIKQLIEVMTQLKFNISFLKMPAAEALKNASRARGGTIRSVIEDMSENISINGMSPSFAWQMAADNNKANLCITDEDKIILKDFAENLGTGDIDSECRNIDAAYAKLSLAKVSAEGECDRMYKLLKGVGMLGGMLLAILLL